MNSDTLSLGAIIIVCNAIVMVISDEHFIQLPDEHICWDMTVFPYISPHFLALLLEFLPAGFPLYPELTTLVCGAVMCKTQKVTILPISDGGLKIFFIHALNRFFKRGISTDYLLDVSQRKRITAEEEMLLQSFNRCNDECKSYLIAKAGVLSVEGLSAVAAVESSKYFDNQGKSWPLMCCFIPGCAPGSYWPLPLQTSSLQNGLISIKTMQK